MSKLSDAIQAKLAADGISATAAARSVGLSLPSFRAALKGKSAPNARSTGKYAKLLGVSEAEIVAMGGGEAKPAKKGKAAKKVKAGKKGKPGRKPGKKAKKGKPGRKPGKKGKPGRKPGRKASTGGFAPVISLLSMAEEILSDDLALAVHSLSKAQRSTVAMIVKSLS